MTLAGRLFHIRIAAGKKLFLYASMNPDETWNLRLWPLVLRVFGMRYDEAGIAINPCLSIHRDGSGMSSAFLHRIPAKLLQHDGWTILDAIARHTKCLLLGRP